MVTSEIAPLTKEVVGLTDRPYQREGVDFLWSTRRAMITDAPGLGKTPQAALAAELPCIVVCPTYLTEQWGAWLKEHFPTRKVAVARGNRQQKMETITTPWEFLVVNKEMLRTHGTELLVIANRYHYKTLIIDEAHHFRNRSTSVAKNIVMLGQICSRVYELTATPIWKEVDDLFMQLRILYPDIFTSYWKFVDTWCNATTDYWGTKVTGVKKGMQAELNQMMDELRIGRTYEQAGRDLPPVIENQILLDFNPTERKRYDELVETYRLQLTEQDSIIMTSYMEVMHTLRNMTGLEKVQPIVDTLEDNHEVHQGKYVVFTWYKDLAERLSAALEGSILITGDMPPAERQAAAKKQQPIVATISALSEGVDLSWARAVVFAEEHWTPGSQVQSLMRVRRERQVDVPTDVKLDGWANQFEVDQASHEANEAPVLVYYAIVKDSIDQTIHNATRRRAATVKEVLSEALGIYL